METCRACHSDTVNTALNDARIHWPVVGKKGKEVFAAKLAYADEVQFAEAFYRFNMAKSVEQFRRGLDMNQLMPQNVMVADTGGNIYYQRAGRVPRASGRLRLDAAGRRSYERHGVARHPPGAGPDLGAESDAGRSASLPESILRPG